MTSPSSNSSHEEEEKKQQQQQLLEPMGFLHPELVARGKEVVIRWLKMTGFLGFAILGLLSLFWGSLYNIQSKFSDLTVLVVDFDSQVEPYLNTEPIVGPLIANILQGYQVSSGAHLGYRFRLPSQYNNDPLQVRRSVYEERYWAAVIINANATTLLNQALEVGNSSYDPMGAAQIIFVEARQETVVDEYVLPELQRMQDEAKATFGSLWISRIASTVIDNVMRQNIEAAPQVLNPAIGFTTYNLRPFDTPVATPATSVGLIYLIIFSFFSFPFYLPIHSAFLAPGGHRPLKFTNSIIWRIFASITTFGFLSLCYSLVSLAFGVPFSREPGSPFEPANASAYGRGSFVVYWMLNWIGMTAFGLPSENMCMLLGAPWFSLWLIFWVICNVCVSFYLVELSPAFYRYGYAWPMHNMVKASRTIIFDTHSRIGLNFGVLFTWCAISIVLFPFCAAVARRRAMRERAAQAEQKRAAEEKKREQEMEEMEEGRPATVMSVSAEEAPPRPLDAPVLEEPVDPVDPVLPGMLRRSLSVLSDISLS